MILFTQIINFTLQVLIVLLIVQFIRRKEEIVAALIRAGPVSYVYHVFVSKKNLERANMLIS